MDNRKTKVLIVTGNVIAIIAIISIILLYNFDTQSVTIDEKDSRVEDPEENADSKSEPSIEFRKINHSESVARDIDETEDDKDELEAEKDETDDEDIVESTKEEQHENNKETGTSQTSETEWTAVSDHSNDSESQRRYSSNQSSSNDSTSSRDKKASDEPSKEKNKSVKESKEEKTEEKNEPVKEEVTCSEGQTKQNGKCVDNKQVYYSKVQSRLPSGFSAGLSGSSITISNTEGTVATISVNSVSQNKIHFSTNEETISKIDGALAGLIY